MSPALSETKLPCLRCERGGLGPRNEEILCGMEVPGRTDCGESQRAESNPALCPNQTLILEIKNKLHTAHEHLRVDAAMQSQVQRARANASHFRSGFLTTSELDGNRQAREPTNPLAEKGNIVQCPEHQSLITSYAHPTRMRRE